MMAFFKKKPSWNFWIITGYLVIIVLFCAFWLWQLLVEDTNAVYNSLKEKGATTAQNIAAGVELANETNIEQFLKKATSDSNYQVLLLDTNGNIMAGNGALAPNSTEIIAKTLEFGSDVGTLTASNTVSHIYATSLCTYNGKLAIVQVLSINNAIAEKLIPRQVLDLGILLTGLLLFSLVAYICYLYATSSVKRLERLRTQFVANASHELKTPVTGIKLLSESIIRAIKKGDTNSIAALAQRIDRKTSRLEEIVNNLVNLSRYESIIDIRNPNRNHLLETVNFTSVVKTSFASRKIFAEGKGLDYRLNIKIPDGSLCLTRIPAASAPLIVDNLIDNAIQYTQNGFIEVTLSVSHSEIILQVEDSGIGISQREKKMVFERFYSSRKEYSSNPQSTGLGLSIVKDLVSASGGSIELRSAPKKGSLFKVRLPLISESN